MQRAPWAASRWRKQLSVGPDFVIQLGTLPLSALKAQIFYESTHEKWAHPRCSEPTHEKVGTTFHEVLIWGRWDLRLIIFYIYINLFIYFWLCWVFVSVWGLSLVVASGGHSSSQCAGLSLSRPLLLRSTGSKRAGSVVVAHRPSCSEACEIFPDQGSNPCPLHWQADSQPLCHQGSPKAYFKAIFLKP